MYEINILSDLKVDLFIFEKKSELSVFWKREAEFDNFFSL